MIIGSVRPQAITGSVRLQADVYKSTFVYRRPAST